MMDETRTPEHAAAHAAGQVGHETRDVSFRPVVFASIGLVVVMLIVFVSMRWLLVHYAVREARLSPPVHTLASQYARELPPEPRLQAAPLDDLQRLRAEEDATLRSYGWVDERAGIVRIPIERAIDLLAERGLPPAPTGGQQ